jgi:hypothetical protein
MPQIEGRGEKLNLIFRQKFLQVVLVFKVVNQDRLVGKKG